MGQEEKEVKKEKVERETIIPVNGRVYVIPQKPTENVSEGGLILSPSAADNKPEIGIILTYDKKDEHPLNEILDIGIRIIFNKFAAAEIELFKGKKCLVLNKESIYGIYKKVEK